MIGICTDSTAQLPAALVERYGIEVVPVTLTIDDHEYLEGVDLCTDRFYSLFADGNTPSVSTSQPSPGQFALAYDALVARGCTEIVSVHVAASASGTLNSARLAKRAATVPVKLVDSHTASFGVACCAWAAAEAAANGACFAEVVRVAETLAPQIHNAFIVGALDLVRAGGRAGDDVMAELTGIPVLSLVNGKVQVVEMVQSLEDAAAAIASSLHSAHPLDQSVNVAIGVADSAAAPLGAALDAIVRCWENVRDIVHYRVGPSIGAHTGPGTAGAFVYPA